MNFEIKRGTSTFRKLAMRALSKPVDIVVVMKGGVGWWVGRMVGGGRSGLLIAPVVPTDNSYLYYISDPGAQGGIHTYAGYTFRTFVYFLRFLNDIDIIKYSGITLIC